MLKCRFLNEAEFRAAEEARMALGTKRGQDPAWLAANKTAHGWATLTEITGPGVMWCADWYFDPKKPDAAARRNAALAFLRANPTGNYHLSKFYWEQWSDKRPPIIVLCPNGAEWCVDAKSSNGLGWTVTGEPPLISCAPSIDVHGYHGFLGIGGAPPGHFTPDLAKRGPGGMGLPR